MVEQYCEVCNGQLICPDCEKAEEGLKVFCCGEEITEFEDGVNGTDFYKCEKCGKTYNILTGKEE